LSPPTSTTTSEAYIASGGSDGDVKLWKPSGEWVCSCNHGAIVTALKTFRDDYGGYYLFIFIFKFIFKKKIL
jgi:WD40 repeat protein